MFHSLTDSAWPRWSLSFPTKVKGTVPASAPTTDNPQIMQAIEAVKLCEVAEGVDPVKPHNPVKVTVKGAYPGSAPNPVKVKAPKSVTAVNGTVPVSVPNPVKVTVPASFITVKGVSPASAPILVKVTVPASVTTVKGTSVPNNLTPCGTSTIVRQPWPQNEPSRSPKQKRTQDHASSKPAHDIKWDGLAPTDNRRGKVSPVKLFSVLVTNDDHHRVNQCKGDVIPKPVVTVSTDDHRHGNKC